MLTRIRANNGQSLIEMAFVFPVFILLLFGAAEYGRLCYYGIEVTNAASAAAAYGSQNRGTSSDAAGMTTAATNEAANVANLSVTPQQLCAATYSDTPTTTNCTAGGTPAIVYVQVNTQATVASLFQSGNGRTYTLRGQAIERVRQ